MRLTLSASYIYDFIKISCVFCVLSTIVYITAYEPIKNSVKQDVLLAIDLETAQFELEKEHIKYLEGRKSSIRKANLDIVLRNRNQLLQRNPELVSKLIWAGIFYECLFVKRKNIDKC